MSLSTLRARLPPPDSLSSLTDDSLLLILRFFSVPQLLAFLSLSRRINHLIVQYTLPHYQSILMHNERHLSSDYLQQSIVFSRRFYRQTDIFFSQTFVRLPVKALRSGQVHRTLLTSLPLHLPHCLSRLRSLTFSYYLDLDLPQSQANVNALFLAYLQSPWRQSLVSLEVHLMVTNPAPCFSNDPLFRQLNHLPALRHLSLLISPLYSPKPTYHIPPIPERLLPDSMPVLGQLDSFSLARYRAGNVPALLHQLAPNLTSLSLYLVVCSEGDFLSFLRSKPTYRESLRTLEIHFSDWWIPRAYGDPIAPQLSTLASHGLPLERLIGSRHLIAYREGNLFTCLTVLTRGFPRLRELGYLTVYTDELRALQEDHSSRITLPRLASLRRVYLYILSDDSDGSSSAVQLFDRFLPLLGAVFCAVEYIEILFNNWGDGSPRQSDSDRALLAEQLVVKMKVHFPSARTCKGDLWPGGGRTIRWRHWDETEELESEDK